MPNQHSPRERPEVDRYEHQPDGTWKFSNGDWVRYDEHRAALLAAEGERDAAQDLNRENYAEARKAWERAETAEGERDRFDKQAAELADDVFMAEARAKRAESHAADLKRYRDMAGANAEGFRRRAQTAEKHLVEARAELETLIERVERDRREPDKLLCHLASAKRSLLHATPARPCTCCKPDCPRCSPTDDPIRSTARGIAPEESGDEDCSRFGSTLDPRQRGVLREAMVLAFCEGATHADELYPQDSAVVERVLRSATGSVADNFPALAALADRLDNGSGTTKKQPAPSGEWPDSIPIGRHYPGAKPYISDDPDFTRETFELRRYVPAETEGERR